MLGTRSNRKIYGTDGRSTKRAIGDRSRRNRSNDEAIILRANEHYCQLLMFDKKRLSQSQNSARSSTAFRKWKKSIIAADTPISIASIVPHLSPRSDISDLDNSTSLVVESQLTTLLSIIEIFYIILLRRIDPPPIFQITIYISTMNINNRLVLIHRSVYLSPTRILFISLKKKKLEKELVSRYQFHH